VTRGYGQVIVGRRLEALAPAVGQLIIIDPSNGAGPLRLRVERRNGPGRMYFDDFGRPSPTTILYAHAQRTSPGWPGHWGAEVTLTGPGCWHLHIRGKGIDDRLVFPVDRGDWRRGWRPQQAVRRGRPHP
jgi:hypothetical protein